MLITLLLSQRALLQYFYYFASFVNSAKVVNYSSCLVLNIGSFCNCGFGYDSLLRSHVGWTTGGSKGVLLKLKTITQLKTERKPAALPSSDNLAMLSMEEESSISGGSSSATYYDMNKTTSMVNNNRESGQLFSQAPASVAIQEAYMVNAENREGRYLLLSSAKADELATHIRIYKKIAL